MTGPALPGALDPLITALAAAGARIDDATRQQVLDRHGGIAACPACGFRYRGTGTRRCPSVLAVTVSLRAGLDAIPPTHITRPCQRCRGPVPVPADQARLPGAVVLCASCTRQPSLFDDPDDTA